MYYHCPEPSEIVWALRRGYPNTGGEREEQNFGGFYEEYNETFKREDFVMMWGYHLGAMWRDYSGSYDGDCPHS